MMSNLIKTWLHLLWILSEREGEKEGRLKLKVVDN
jgi:hypothetical protein